MIFMGRKKKRRAAAKRKGNRYRVSPEVKRERRRRFFVLTGYACTFLLVVFLVSSFFVMGYRYLVTTPYLCVKNIEVHGCRWLSKEQVKRLSGVSKGQNLLALNLRKIREKIEKNSWIKAVTLTRSIPDTLYIEVEEKEPMAFVRIGETYLVDSDGELIKRVEDETKYRNKHYLAITGLDKEKVLCSGKIPAEVCSCVRQFIVMAESNGGWFDLKKISEARWSKLSGLSISFENGLVVNLGRGNFSLKFSMLRRVLSEISKRRIAGEVKEIDLRCSPRVYISGRFTGNLIPG